MFGQSNPTQYDVKFQLFQIPVRVHPFFWLFTLLLGYDSFAGPGGTTGMQLAVIWTLAVFVSIIVHEFGHALSARAFGWRVHEVVLQQFGGYAALSPTYRASPFQDVLITLAGPSAGFLFYGLIQGFLFLFGRQVSLENWQLQVLFHHLLFINLAWGLFNLIPVFPLDGGRALRTIFGSFSPNGIHAAHLISVIVGGLGAVCFYQIGQTWVALMLAILAFENFQILNAPRYR